MKKIKIVLFFVFLIYSFSVLSPIFTTPVYALGKIVEVYDYANLLTNEEIIELKEYAQLYSYSADINVLFVTTYDADGKTSMEYADDFYDEITGYQEEYSGILFLIDMDNREIYISTAGNAIIWLNDEEIEVALDKGFKYVKNGKYGKCMEGMSKYALSTIQHWCSIEKDGNERDSEAYKSSGKKIKDFSMNLFQKIILFFKKLVIGIIWLIIGFIMTLLRGLFGFAIGGGKHSSGSSHRSSSGRSHGGGGRKF